MRRYLIAMAAAALLALSGSAQTPETAAKAPAPDDPNARYFPDPTHIPFFRPDQIPWTGEAGKEQQYNVYGDPRKPGPYALLLKWFPGNYSKPHFHGKPRYIVVVSGTWWVSSSNHYDPTKTYPLGPGTVVSDVVNTVHWDGARDEPVVLMIVGEGPVPNVNVDENGKPKGPATY